MSEPKEYLLTALKSVVDAGAVEMVIECIEAYENKTDRDGILSYVQDIFNVQKEKELRDIIWKYISLVLKKDADAKVPQNVHKVTLPSKPNRNTSGGSDGVRGGGNNTNKGKKGSNYSDSKSSLITQSGPLPNGKIIASKQKAGKPSWPKCKCMATKHKFYASCHACGNIMCEKDSECTFCSFCNHELIPVKTANEVESEGYNADTIKAYKQLDKLLLFDKEHTKRTHIHDAQSDYYDSSVWLSDKEKKIIDEKEKKRRENKNKLYANRKINISFDIAGRKVVEYQLNDEPEETGEGESWEENGENDSEVADKGFNANAFREKASYSGNIEPSSVSSSNWGSDRHKNIVSSTDILRDSIGAATTTTTTATTVAANVTTDSTIPIHTSDSIGSKSGTGTGNMKPSASSADVPIIYDDNRELEYNAGRAGEVYRFMKKAWENQDRVKLGLAVIKDDDTEINNSKAAINEQRQQKKANKTANKPNKTNRNSSDNTVSTVGSNTGSTVAELVTTSASQASGGAGGGGGKKKKQSNKAENSFF